MYKQSRRRGSALIFRFSIGVVTRRPGFSSTMRAAGVAWPLQTAVIAFSRCATVPVVTSRTLSVSFHALSSVQRHSRLIRVWRKDTCRGCDINEISLTRSRGSRRMVIRCLNRIMLEPSEVVRGDDGGFFAKLSAADSRTQHVQSVLKAADGEPVRVGIVDRGLIDDATIRWKEPNELPEGSPRPDIPSREKDRKAAPTWRDLVVDLGRDERLLDQVHEERRPRVALILALPRPLQLGRILPMISNLGVDTLVLCHASKVERMYFGSHLFRDPRKMREKLIEGLSQSGDTVLPKVVVARHLKIFLEDDLDRHFPRERWVRTVAHPTRLDTLAGHADDEAGKGNRVQGGHCGASVRHRDLPARGLRFAELKPPAGCDPADAGILVTIGPEGGWVEPDELELLQSFGFQAVTLGTKILRSDVAVCAALALAHAWVDERSRGGIFSPN